jgi:hypothetical protein
VADPLIEAFSFIRTGSARLIAPGSTFIDSAGELP